MMKYTLSARISVRVRRCDYAEEVSEDDVKWFRAQVKEAHEQLVERFKQHGYSVETDAESITY